MLAEESASDGTATDQTDSRSPNPKLAKKIASELRGEAVNTEKINA